LQIMGAGSPHVQDSVDLNSRLNPSKSNWLKVDSFILIYRIDETSPMDFGTGFRQQWNGAGGETGQDHRSGFAVLARTWTLYKFEIFGFFSCL